MTPKDLIENQIDEASAIQTQDLDRLLKGMLQISEMVGSVMLLDDILDRIVGITCELMNTPISSIYLLNEERRLVLNSNIGFEPELRGKAGFKWGEGIPGWVAQHGELLALADATRDSRYKPLPSSKELGCNSYLCAPLRIQDNVIGVMSVRKRGDNAFTRGDILFFATVCKQVSIVIEKARMYEGKIEAERLAAVALSLTGVAHYIKNVLQTMKGGEYLVEQGLQTEDMGFLREGWDVLRRANVKIRGLVENILNFCRNAKPIPRQVALNGMILDMLGALGHHAHQRRVRLVPELDQQLVELWLDPEQIHDALLNLVGNAVDACPADGTGIVTVRTSRLDGRRQALVEVIDNGHGVPEEMRDKIFNLFFSTKGQTGTGIGLAATRKIIEDHGGTIELESTVDQGTRFRIYLPTGTNSGSTPTEGARS